MALRRKEVSEDERPQIFTSITPFIRYTTRKDTGLIVCGILYFQRIIIILTKHDIQ